MATSNSPQTGIYKKQIGPGRDTTMVIDEGGNLDITSGSITLPGSLSIGYISLGAALFGARNMASGETLASGTTAPTAFFGGLLMPDGEPSLGFNSTADHVWRMQWTSANVAAIATLPVALPNDMSTAGGFTIELFGESIGTGTASDAIAAVTILPRFGIGAASGAGSTHPNFTSTPSWQGITVASGTVTTDNLSIQLTPQAHAGRAIRLYDMRASYTKKTS